MTRDAQKLKDIFALLHAIERGEVTLSSKDPDDIFAGNVDYIASNGAVLIVFNDCNTWDYLDSIVLPDGRTADFDEMLHLTDEDERSGLWTGPSGYRPSDEVAWDAYAIDNRYLADKAKKLAAPKFWALQREPGEA